MTNRRRHGMRILLQSGVRFGAFGLFHRLERLCGSFYSCPVGIDNLKKLGYAVGFLRGSPDVPETGSKCDWFLVRLTRNNRLICKETGSGMKRGLCTSMPRGLRVKAIFRATSSTGQNVQLRKRTFVLHALYLFNKEELIDVKVIDGIETRCPLREREHDALTRLLTVALLAIAGR